MAFKEARKSDAQRFSSSRETLAELTEKRRNAPAREVFSDADAPLPQYDPSDEAGFEPDASESFDEAESNSGMASMPLHEAIERVPAMIRNFVRERFHAEFSRVRASRNMFSYRDFGGENNAEEAEDPSDDSDDV